jgi:ketosteroid isomerase-like protein
VSSTATSDSDIRGAAFVRRFADFWSAPDPDRLGAVLTSDVTLIQPMAPPTHGLTAAQEAFRRLFVLVPDLRGTVDRWSASGDVVFIEFRLHGTFGGRAIEWPAVDRFTLRGDLGSERVSYFDPTPLLPHLARRPVAALRWWWSGASVSRARA